MRRYRKRMWKKQRQAIMENICCRHTEIPCVQLVIVINNHNNIAFNTCFRSDSLKWEWIRNAMKSPTWPAIPNPRKIPCFFFMLYKNWSLLKMPAIPSTQRSCSVLAGFTSIRQAKFTQRKRKQRGRSKKKKNKKRIENIECVSPRVVGSRPRKWWTIWQVTSLLEQLAAISFPWARAESPEVSAEGFGKYHVTRCGY